MSGAHSVTAPERVETTERRANAVRLRISGKTYDQIGASMGITRQAAHELVTNALTDYREDCEEKVPQLREIEMDRLDTVQAAIWDKVIKGDNQSIDRLLRIMQRRAMLCGLDAPQRVDLTGRMMPAEVERIRDQYAALAGLTALPMAPPVEEEQAESETPDA